MSIDHDRDQRAAQETGATDTASPEAKTEARGNPLEPGG